MGYGFRASVKCGRYVGLKPTRHLLSHLQKVDTDGDKKGELQHIVEQKPVVDELIEKVAKLKIKPKKSDTEKILVKKEAEYIKKLSKKPKKRISIEF